MSDADDKEITLHTIFMGQVDQRRELSDFKLQQAESNAEIKGALTLLTQTATDSKVIQADQEQRLRILEKHRAEVADHETQIQDIRRAQQQIQMSMVTRGALVTWMTLLASLVIAAGTVLVLFK